MKKYMGLIMVALLSVVLFIGCGKSGGDTKLEEPQRLEVKIDYKDVKTIELYDLDQKKVREFSKEEHEKIVDYVNSSKTTNNPHIEMITGNIMKVTFNDNSELNFSSYGSETNCVVGGKYKGKDFNHHLISPEIAKILLEK